MEIRLTISNHLILNNRGNSLSVSILDSLLQFQASHVHYTLH